MREAVGPEPEAKPADDDDLLGPVDNLKQYFTDFFNYSELLFAEESISKIRQVKREHLEKLAEKYRRQISWYRDAWKPEVDENNRKMEKM